MQSHNTQYISSNMLIQNEVLERLRDFFLRESCAEFILLCSLASISSAYHEKKSLANFFESNGPEFEALHYVTGVENHQKVAAFHFS